MLPGVFHAHPAVAMFVEPEPSPYESPSNRLNEPSSVWDRSLYPILPPAVYCTFLGVVTVCRRYVSTPAPARPCTNQCSLIVRPIENSALLA